MTQYKNAKLVPAITPEASGELLLDRQVTNLATPGYWPPAIALGDQLQIGKVPAGCVLVPWLCNIALPQLDSNGSATLSVSIGTAATPAALKATAAAGAAANVAGSALAPGVVIGDPVNDTPIFLTATAAAATAAQTGKVIADLVFRPWRDDTDTGNQTA